MNNNCIFRNYSEMYIQSQSLTIICWLPVFYMLFMHNYSGLATRLSVSPPCYNPRPGVGASGPRSTPIDCLPVTVWRCRMGDIAWLPSSFDKFSSLFIYSYINYKQTIQFCNESRPQRHHPFFPSGRTFQVIFNRNFYPKQSRVQLRNCNCNCNWLCQNDVIVIVIESVSPYVAVIVIVIEYLL